MRCKRKLSVDPSSTGARMRRLLFALCSMLFVSTHAVAQQVDCQAIMQQLLSGAPGFGSFEHAQQLGNLYNQYCLGGGGYQQPNGIQCGYGTCPFGTTCCAQQCCNAGYQCSSAGCIPEGSADCGNGQYCPPGRICWRAPASIGGQRRGQLSCPTPEDASILENQIAKEREELRAAERKAAEEKRKAQAEAKFKADAPARQKVSELLKDDVWKQRTAHLQKSTAVQDQAMQKFLAEYGPRSAKCQLVGIGWGAAAGTQCALQELQAKANTAAPPVYTPKSPDQVQKELEALAKGQRLSSAAGLAAPTALTKQQYDYLKANAATLQPEKRKVASGLIVAPATPNFAVQSTFPTIRRPDSPARDLARQEQVRAQLWPRMGVPSSQPPLALSADKVRQDWDALQLAGAAYRDNLQPGAPVFRGNDQWRVLDRREDTASGFLAYAFVNPNDHRIVVAVQGSRSPVWLLDGNGLTASGRDARRDWSQDVGAIAAGQVPAQFRQAEAYVRDISTRYGSQYIIDCSGHSLGGGACVYAAAQVGNVHAAVVTPVSSNSLPTTNAYLIDNYAVSGDAASVGHSITERGLTGWQYQVTGSGLGNIPIVSMATRHDLDRVLDAMGEATGLQRYELAQ
jgi:hypothetical protein